MGSGLTGSAAASSVLGFETIGRPMRSNSTRGDGGGEGVNALGGTGTLIVALSSLLTTGASGDTGAGGNGLTLTGDEA